MSVKDDLASVKALRFIEQASNPTAGIEAGFAHIFRKVDGFYVIDESSVVSMLVQAPDAATPQTIIQVADITNTLIGDNVGSPSSGVNVYVGGYAGNAATSSQRGVFVGYEAGASITTGDNNTAVGFDAAYSLEDGANNIAVGALAMFGIIGGSHNIGIGVSAIQGVTTGDNMTAIGHQAGLAAGNESGSVYIGAGAGNLAGAGSNQLWIHNSNSATPLIYGAFDNKLLVFNGTVTITDGRRVNPTIVNAATYDLLTTDYILHVTYTATGAVTSLTLPTALVANKMEIIVKDAGANAATNSITIDTEGAETIDGIDTFIMDEDNMAINLYSDGSNWFLY